METQVSLWQRLLKLEPALLRGVLVTVAALLASIIGDVVIDDETIENIVQAFSAISALIAAVWTRSAVTANAKVVVRDDTPLASVSTLRAGEAIPSEYVHADTILNAALSKGRHAA